jgi:hypothetical protein
MSSLVASFTSSSPSPLSRLRFVVFFELILVFVAINKHVFVSVVRSMENGKENEQSHEKGRK